MGSANAALRAKSFTAKIDKGAEDEKSLTAEAAEVAKENKNLTAEDAEGNYSRTDKARARKLRQARHKEKLVIRDPCDPI